MLPSEHEAGAIDPLDETMPAIRGAAPVAPTPDDDDALARTMPSIAAHAPPFASGPFEFVRQLAAELSQRDVQLPSFPDVAKRVRDVLSDPRSTPAQIAGVIGSDAALAARLLRIANSAVFNPSGKTVTGVQGAVSRLGHEVVRCAAVSFAVQQMKASVRHPHLRPQLQELWRKSTLVAALANAVARATRAVNPDEATIAGLLHNVGRLYILARAESHAPAFQAAGTWDEVLHDWHPQIGRSILEHWKFPETVCVAVAEQNTWDRPRSPTSALPDVLVCATSLVPCVYYRDLLEETVPAVSAFKRLELDPAQCRDLLTASAQQIRQLRDVLMA
jgi:HD-like signal output (HDOD) protein